ncbi:aminodeoxychorismate lyase [Candidatus Blochmanniella vafra str. BVAF]|uniref:Aminodeoxychorismate lyase n=1 Tax=Blochmanniella vafra (strain BVAF) TaxID=859654 RepID=E8Q6A4_BLOVB|nr:aminodeoxychorismate lyase [Candidatus Blochmannia vafer]ADV33798.1 aminodeoxychorismate lyase [Candidatus Blochmannia vafer str. BVAF]
MYWVNGVLQTQISLNNRALHFGDGFFTTSQIKKGEVQWLSYHMDRLILSARRLMFDNVNFHILYKEILKAANYSKYGIIKIIITRMSYDRVVYGYGFDDKLEILRIIRVLPCSEHYKKLCYSGVRLKISSIRLSRNPLLSGIKHLNRLEQVLIASEIYRNKKNIDDVLVLDTENNIVECCSANIFWRKKNKVFTPYLHHAGVNGVIRQVILKILPDLGYVVQEVMVGIEHLKEMEEVFITNSLLPLASVNVINNYFYSDKTLLNLLKFHIIN